MVTQTPIYTQGKYTVMYNSQVNAYNPYSVVNTETGRTVFSYESLAVCLDYISDNTQ